MRWDVARLCLSAGHAATMCAVSRQLLLSATLVVWLVACNGAPRPYLIVHVCVRDDRGFEILRSELAQVADSMHMTYVDGSEWTQRSVERMTTDTVKRSDNTPYLNIQLNRSDGLGVGAGNLGLPGYEVALAFNAGRDHAESVRFANDVVGRLRGHWNVDTVPAGEGAKPMGGCN